MAELDELKTTQTERALEAVPGKETNKINIGIRELIQMHEDATHAPNRSEERWKQEWDFYNSDMWDTDIQSDKVSYKSNINLIYAFIETLVASLTDTNPIIDVRARKESERKYEADVGMILQYIWDTENMDSKLTKPLRDMLINGVGIFKLTYQPLIEQDGFLGKVDIQPIDPAMFLIDPMATSLDAARYVIHQQVLPYDWVIENYPDKVDEIPTGEWNIHQTFLNYLEGVQEGREFEGVFRNIQDTNKKKVIVPSVRGEQARFKGFKVSVLEYYIRVDEKAIQRIVVANGVVLENEPFQSMNIFPFVDFHFAPTTKYFWDNGLIYYLKGLQMDINKLTSLVFEYMIYNIRAPVIISGTPSEKQEFRLHPGEVWQLMEGSTVSRLTPAAFPGAIFNLIQLLQNYMEIMSGNIEIVQGRRPLGVETGRALQVLLEQANIKMRMISKNVKVALERLARIAWEFITSFWEDTRYIVATNRERGEKIFKEINMTRLKHTFGFLFNFDVGTMVPFSRIALGSELESMYEKGVLGDLRDPKQQQIARKKWLETIQLPGYEKLLNDLQQIIDERERQQQEAIQAQLLASAGQQQAQQVQ